MRRWNLSVINGQKTAVYCALSKGRSDWWLRGLRSADLGSIDNQYNEWRI